MAPSPASQRGQRGQSTVELGGLLVLIALAMVALMSAGIPQAAARGVVCGVSRALGGHASCAASTASGGSGAAAPGAAVPGSSGDPWNSTNPVTRATWGRYVSLGDSYSAGEGLGDYEAGSHVEPSQCQIQIPFGPCIYHKDPKVIDGCDRSGFAYNKTVTDRYTFRGGKGTYACSGSITKDIYDPADPRCTAGHASGTYGEGCQVDHVTGDTSLVTMSIGGNDVGFAKDLLNCYMHDAEKLTGPNGSCAFEGPAIDRELAALGPNLEADLRAIRARAPHARIILMTYPRLFGEPPTGNVGCVGPNLCLTPADQEFFNQQADKLDAAICADAAAAGVGAECVNASGAFDGCELGQANSCLQAPQLQIHDQGWSVPLGTNAGAYHPTQRGQAILGELIDHEIQDPPPGVGPPS